MQPVTGRRACDGPSCRSSQSSETQISTKGLWRSVTPVTVRHTCDGPSCHFVTKFRESIFSTQFSVFLSVLKRGPATVHPAGRRKVQRMDFHWSLRDGPSRLWRSFLPFRHEVQRVDFQYPISDFLSVLKRDPVTVRRAHDGPSLGSSPLPNFPEIKSAAQND